MIYADNAWGIFVEIDSHYRPLDHFRRYMRNDYFL